MMNPLFRYLIASMLTLTSAAALAQNYDVGPIKLEQPWTRATPGGAKVAGGYLGIANTGVTPDRFLGGSSDIASRVEIHKMAVKDGVMSMRELPGGLAIEPGGKAEFKPGGYHLMFQELKRPLKEGETVKATLVFEKAGPVAVEFTVQSIGAREPAHKH